MERILLGRVPVDAITLEETVIRASKGSDKDRTKAFHIVTVNAQFVQIANRDELFRQTLLEADLSVADGVPLLWASRLLGTPLPGRVNGTDLMTALCEQAALTSARVYFLGGRTTAAQLASQKLCAMHSSLRVAGVDCPAMGFMEDAELRAGVACRIELAAPDYLFVALGAPQQEFWIQQYRSLPARVMIGVGGSFELIAGLTRRAPLPMQRVGLEWFWRLAVEPRRLWKRYLVGNSLFIFLILRQWFSESFRTKAHSGSSLEIEKGIK